MSEYKENAHQTRSEKKAKGDKLDNDQSEKDDAMDDTRPRHAGVGWGTEDSPAVCLDDAKTDTKRGRRMRGNVAANAVKNTPKNQHFDDAKGVTGWYNLILRK